MPPHTPGQPCGRDGDSPRGEAGRRGAQRGRGRGAGADTEKPAQGGLGETRWDPRAPHGPGQGHKTPGRPVGQRPELEARGVQDQQHEKEALSRAPGADQLAARGARAMPALSSSEHLRQRPSFQVEAAPSRAQDGIPVPSQPLSQMLLCSEHPAPPDRGDPQVK